MTSPKRSGSTRTQCAYRLRGRAWADKGEPDKAIADFSEAIRLDPKDADTFAQRGEAWRARGEPDKAFADYDQAIRLAPEEASPLCPARQHPARIGGNTTRRWPITTGPSGSIPRRSSLIPAAA